MYVVVLDDVLQMSCKFVYSLKYRQKELREYEDRYSEAWKMSEPKPTT